MKELDDYTKGCAQILKNLRLSAALTQQQMADATFVDVKTWRRYESGESTPTVPQFLQIFRTMNSSALPAVLQFLYPETYKGNRGADEERQALTHYINHIASDHAVEALSYCIYGEHGSNWLPQLEEWLMLDHLPLEGRVAVASLLLELYTLFEKIDRLVCTDQAMPDVSIMRAGLENGRDAAHSGRNTYTTI